jgi:hypothetical protein
VPVDFTPGCIGILGGGVYFSANDAEDGCVRVTIVSDRDGPLPYKFTFQTTGERLLTITAVDSQGASVSKHFFLEVVNSAPTLTLQAGGDAHQGEPSTILAQITDPNEVDPGRLCANTVWTVDPPDTVSSPTGCLQTVTFGTTGPRQVRVTTHDSDGASASQTLVVNVLPPPADPFPRLTSVSMNSREIRSSGGADFCVVRGVGDGAHIDLTERGCQIDPAGPAPYRYFIGAAVENPAGEALSYEWNLYATGSSEFVIVGVTSETSMFELGQLSSGFPFSGPLNTLPCRVTLKINAPDPSRSKGPTTVWVGQCTYHLRIPN